MLFVGASIFSEVPAITSMISRTLAENSPREMSKGHSPQFLVPFVEQSTATYSRHHLTWYNRKSSRIFTVCRLLPLIITTHLAFPRSLYSLSLCFFRPHDRPLRDAVAPGNETLLQGRTGLVVIPRFLLFEPRNFRLS